MTILESVQTDLKYIREVLHRIYLGDTLIAAENAADYFLKMITPGQIRAARGLIGWKQSDLAEKSGLALITIKNLERGGDPKSSTINAIQAAFAEAGVIFVDDGDTRPGGPGVRLK